MSGPPLVNGGHLYRTPRALYAGTSAYLATHPIVRPDRCERFPPVVSLSAMIGSSGADELKKYMHYDAAAAKAMGVFPAPGRFQLASALGHGEDGSSGSDFSLFSILNKTCTSMGSRMLKRYAYLGLLSAPSKRAETSLILLKPTVCRGIPTHWW